MVVLALVLLGCPHRELSPLPARLHADCAGIDADPTCDGAGDRGLDPKHPLEWGPAGVEPLWYGRLVCPGGADPEVVRLPDEARARPSDTPRSGLPGQDRLVATRVTCPGRPAETWWVSRHRCGDPCPPRGFGLVSGAAMDTWIASRKAWEVGDFAAARDLAAAAEALAPEVERVAYWRGVTALHEGEVGAALQAFERANAVDPTDLDGLFWLALVQRQADLTARADATTERALSLVRPGDPARGQVLCLGAAMRRRQGDAAAGSMLARAACEEGFEPCCR